MTVPLWSHRYTCSGPWWHTTVWPTHRSVTSCFLVSCTASLHSPPNQGPYNSLAYLFIQQDWRNPIVGNPRSVLHFFLMYRTRANSLHYFRSHEHLIFSIHQWESKTLFNSSWGGGGYLNKEHVMKACLVDR